MEYVIWGIAPNTTEEQLLLTTIAGKPITRKEQAEEYQKLLETRHECTQVRIQTIDLGSNPINDFIRAVK